MTDQFSQQTMKVHGPELVSYADFPHTPMFLLVCLLCHCIVSQTSIFAVSAQVMLPSHLARLSQSSLDTMSLRQIPAKLPAD
jgi:ABC-type protease/lipase transport system fused ATPase/permease subunit